MELFSPALLTSSNAVIGVGGGVTAAGVAASGSGFIATVQMWVSGLLVRTQDGRHRCVYARATVRTRGMRSAGYIIYVWPSFDVIVLILRQSPQLA